METMDWLEMGEKNSLNFLKKKQAKKRTNGQDVNAGTEKHRTQIERDKLNFRRMGHVELVDTVAI